MKNSKKIDLEKINKVYFIGIKGSGVIAFVEIFHGLGKEVVGSDTTERFFTDETLKELDVRFYEGFSVENIRKELPVDLVVHSTVYSEENNEELKFAKEKEIPVLSYPEMIGQFMKTKYGVAVCGTHGKTTTTAMLALAMKNAGADPTAIIGSKIKQLKSNTMVGKSDYFVLEADEYQNKFFHYNPVGVVLLNLDYDHPDFFKSFQDYLEVFKEFVRKIPSHGFLVVWGESAYTLEVAKEARCKVIFFGAFREENPYATAGQDSKKIEKIDERKIDGIKEDFEKAGKRNIDFVITPPLYEMVLEVAGRHNRLNATAALAVCRHFGLDEKKVMESLKGYQGAARRFEELGTYNKAVVIDDYAHHPEEIKATLGAAREKFPNKKIICVFHPHTFTRTKALLTEFSESFDDADEVIVLDIYGSAREVQGEVHSQDLVEKMKRIGKDVQYLPTMKEAYDYLEDKLGSSNVVITMGAGNVFELGEKLAECDK